MPEVKLTIDDLNSIFNEDHLRKLENTRNVEEYIKKNFPWNWENNELVRRWIRGM